MFWLPRPSIYILFPHKAFGFLILSYTKSPDSINKVDLFKGSKARTRPSFLKLDYQLPAFQLFKYQKIRISNSQKSQNQNI